MSAIVQASPTALQPVVGSAITWSRDFAVFGALLPVASLLPTMPPYLGGNLAMLSLACAVFGGVLGAATPRALNWVRGKVPISLLVVAATTIGAASGMFAGFFAGQDLAFWGVVVQGPMFGLVWLPYTMATVLGRRAWPVLAVGLLAAAPVTAAVIGLLNLGMMLIA